MIIDEQVVGLLLIASSQECGDLQAEVGLIDKISRLASVAIENTQLVEATQAELKRSRALSEISQMLSEARDPMADADRICQTVLEAVDVHRVNLFHADKNNTPMLFSGLFKDELRGSIKQDINHPVSKGSIEYWCLEHNTPALILRDAEDLRESTEYHLVRKNNDVGCSFSIPFQVSKQKSALLSVSRRRSQRDFNESELNIIHTVVNQLSTALKRCELSTDLKYQANHDSLTGVPNRHCFEIELHACLEKLSAEHKAGAVLFLDLDGFKNVNDTMGHAIGDLLLQSVARRLKNRLRDTDTLGRMGGMSLLFCYAVSVA